MSHLLNPKMRSQFNDVFEKQIPLMLVLGEQEIQTETIKIKDIAKSIEIVHKKNQLLEFLKSFFN